MLNLRATMITVRGTLFLILSVTACISQGAEVPFNEDIRPILAEHCLHCHGPDAAHRQADLRLDLEHAAKESSIVPNKPRESEFFQRISSNDPDLRMPPGDTGKPLSAAQIAILKQWIQEGAPYQGHWSFEPIQKPKIPDVGHSTTSEIDRFILSRLKKQGLKLSPALNRQQLIRRATFDLTGLPPTWEEVTAFENDPSPHAFEKVIDRLLASPRYGERWGRHWLDIARFADTHGGSAIGFKKFPFSYTYRDYVIRAFNADLPYNRFVTEQLAADQLELKKNDPAHAALGFLTIGMQFRNPHDTIDDQIDVVTRGLLGLTVACARCHDHKYDAIPTEDYYSLYATLGSSRLEKLPSIIGETPKTKSYENYQKELARRLESYKEMRREQTAIMRGRLRMQVGIYLRELAKGTPEQDLSAAFLSYRTDDLRPLVLNRWRKYLAELPMTDPVFGPWLQLSSLKQKQDFQKQCQTLVASLVKENGDPKKQAAMEKVAANAPRWNPRVLEAILKKRPASLLELADIYGSLFADVQQQWLKVLIGTSLEARPGAQVIPDEDPRHRDANSPINRQLRRHLYAPDTPIAMSNEIAETLLNRPIRDNLRGRAGAIDQLNLTSPGSPPRPMTLREDPLADPFHVFRRGNPIDRGKPVQARFLTALSSANPKPYPAGKQRLGLANSIVDPANPLTRRVIVNWVWQHHFGLALVRTPDDFGTRGQTPTHPKLIDYLATTFMEEDWSLKQLHRRIMLTQVYQQAALEHAESRIKDPSNQLLWRMPRRKLEMEAMRDSMLMVSGELDTKMGGRPFDLLSKTVTPRRSVYAFVNRDIVSSLSSTFDGANPSSCTAQRPNTNVPQQTLFALNSRFIQDRAAALVSHKEIKSATTNTDRVRLLYQRTFSRNPEPQEVEIALRYIQSQTENSKTNPWQRLAHVLLAANEFVFVD